jgi:hypothetical protein
MMDIDNEIGDVNELKRVGGEKAEEADVCLLIDSPFRIHRVSFWGVLNLKMFKKITKKILKISEKFLKNL